MRRRAPLLVILGLPVLALAAGTPETRQHLVERYCLDCHNAADWAGGLALDTEDLSNVSGDAKLWESVVRKVRAGMMPPGGKPRPPRQDMQAFAGGIERELDRGRQLVP